jgi:Tol biopolymer transport system component
VFAHFVQYGRPDSDIRILDLATHHVTTVRGSEGIVAPRWSPDGRYISALSWDLRKMMLYSVVGQSWHELAAGVFHCPAWSRDSRYVYAENSLTNEPAMVRVRIADQKIEQVVSLKDIRRVSVGEFWSGITPDGSPLTMRDVGAQEIYALDLQLP